MPGAIPVNRGCGTRVGGGVYLEVGVSKDGLPLEHFLICPPVLLSPDLGVSPIGVTLIPENRPDGSVVYHVADWIGAGKSTRVGGLCDYCRAAAKVKGRKFFGSGVPNSGDGGSTLNPATAFGDGQMQDNIGVPRFDNQEGANFAQDIAGGAENEDGAGLGLPVDAPRRQFNEGTEGQAGAKPINENRGSSRDTDVNPILDNEATPGRLLLPGDTDSTFTVNNPGNIRPFRSGQVGGLDSFKHEDIVLSGQCTCKWETNGYPNVWDFLGEARNFGISRRLSPELDYSKLSKESRLLCIHPRAAILNAERYTGNTPERFGEWAGRSEPWQGDAPRPFGANWNVNRPLYGGYACAKGITGHEAQTPPEPCCSGIWAQDIEHGAELSDQQRREFARTVAVAQAAGGGRPLTNGVITAIDGREYPADDPRLVLREMPSFRYVARKAPENVEPVYAPAFFASFPLSRLVVVQGKDAAANIEKAKAAKNLNVNLVTE